MQHSCAVTHPLLDSERKDYQNFSTKLDCCEVSNQQPVKLFEQMDGFELKSRIPCSHWFLEDGMKSEEKKGIWSTLEHHEGLVALQAVEVVWRAIVWIYLRHLELVWNSFPQNGIGKGKLRVEAKVIIILLSPALDLTKMALKFLNFCLRSSWWDLLGHGK